MNTIEQKITKEMEKDLLHKLDMVVKLCPNNLLYNYGRMEFGLIDPVTKAKFQVDLRKNVLKVTSKHYN